MADIEFNWNGEALEIRYETLTKFFKFRVSEAIYDARTTDLNLHGERIGHMRATTSSKEENYRYINTQNKAGGSQGFTISKKDYLEIVDEMKKRGIWRNIE